MQKLLDTKIEDLKKCDHELLRI